MDDMQLNVGIRHVKILLFKKKSVTTIVRR